MQIKRAKLWQALLPIVVLIAMLAVNVIVYGDSSLGGPNQIALLLSAAVAAIVGISLNVSWDFMKKGIVTSISSTMTAIIILLLIGALAGTWFISGIVPAMIYYGLQVLNPTIFLFAAVVVSAIVSLATGSSWSTIATVGIALLGIGQAMDIYEGLIAGAIISGAYFGDKMSPLSDTTNLAPAMAGTDLFTHIRHMAWTTIPSIVITLIIFLVIGFNYESSAQMSQIDEILSTIDKHFNINPVLFLVPIIVIFMIVKKVPAIPSLLTGALLGGIFAIIFQPHAIEAIGSSTQVQVETSSNESAYQFEWFEVVEDENEEFVHSGTSVEDLEPGIYHLRVEGDNDVSGMAVVEIPDYGHPVDVVVPLHMYKEIEFFGSMEVSANRTPYLESSYRAVMNALAMETSIKTESEDVNKLLSQGGMAGMLETIWLIVCAMIFGGVMESVGLLQRITESIISLARSRGGLIGTTASTCLFFNVTASDQYLAIVVPGRMYSDTYRKRGLRPENLSRTLEDSGTVTSVLVPWNTCGATQSKVLGVNTIIYAPFCFFNIISPIITVIYGIVGFKVPMLTEEEMKANEAQDSNESDPE